MSKQLALERKRSEQLSKKLDQMASIGGGFSGHARPASQAGSGCSGVENGANVEELKAEIASLKLQHSKRERKTSASSQASGSSGVSKVKSMLKADEPPVDPIDQINLKALNTQLSSLLQDEILKNQALRDNINDLSEQLACALEK